MAYNQDARPFVDLQKDAEEFQTKFVDDIQECKNFLDAKITALMCDPDSLGHLVKRTKQNALLEFSKSKYDIFVSIKSFINDKEREWLKYMSEMKKLFIENVEIFLAGTKLEVKLPSSEFQSSPGPRNSPGNRKSATSSLTSSIYPIITSITKNIPALSSPLRSKEAQSKELEEVLTSEEDIQFNRRGRFPATSIKLANSLKKSGLSYHNESIESSDSESGGEFTSTFAPRGKIMDVKEIDVNEAEMASSLQNLKGCKSQSLGQSLKQLSPQVSQMNNATSEEDEIIEPEQTIDSPHIPSKGRGKQSKQSAKNAEVNNVSESFNVRSRRNANRACSRLKSNAISENSSSTSDEGEKIKETETSNNVSLKGHKGRQTAKSKKNVMELQLENGVTDTKAEEPNVDTLVIVTKGRRGRSAAAKSDVNVSDKSTGTLTRCGRKSVSERITGTSKTLKNVFSADDDVSDDKDTHITVARSTKSAFRRKTLLPNLEETLSDTYIPVARPTKSAVRRKTLLPNSEETLSGDDIIPSNSVRARSKRKTICGVSNLASVAPSKRLKVSSNQNTSAVANLDDTTADDNLLESDESYSEWITLKSIDGKIPICPAIYEVKVWRAKKSAYIGCCDSLRQKLTLHKLKQNSGHKHLDKFIERNYNDIHIRYEAVSSVNDAKFEVKKRIENFVAQHRTTPAYN